MEYVGASSLHGIQYIFESGEGLRVSKGVWLVVVTFAFGLGIMWSKEARTIMNLNHIQIQQYKSPRVVQGGNDGHSYRFADWKFRWAGGQNYR